MMGYLRDSVALEYKVCLHFCPLVNNIEITIVDLIFMYMVPYGKYS